MSFDGHQRRWCLLFVLVYAAVLCLSPLLHHDFDCHLKTPSHCAACMANPTAPRAECVRDPGSTVLPMVETAERPRAARTACLCRLTFQGRAPPA